MQAVSPAYVIYLHTSISWLLMWLVYADWCKAGTFFNRASLQIDFKRPLDQQGPFDIFLHKLTDIIVKAEQDNMDDSQEVELFRVLEVGVRGL